MRTPIFLFFLIQFLVSSSLCHNDPNGHHTHQKSLPLINNHAAGQSANGIGGHLQDSMPTIVPRDQNRRQSSTGTRTNADKVSRPSDIVSKPLDETMAEIIKYAAERLNNVNYDRQRSLAENQVLVQLVHRLDSMEKKIDDMVAMNAIGRVTKLEADMVEEQFSSKVIMDGLNGMKSDLTSKLSDFERKLNFAVDFITRNAMSVDTLLRRTIEVQQSTSMAADVSSSSTIGTKMATIENSITELVKRIDDQDTNRLVDRIGNIERLSSNTYNCLIGLSADTQSINHTINGIKRTLMQPVTFGVGGQSPSPPQSNGTSLVSLVASNELKESLQETRSKMDEMDMDIEVYTRKVINSINVLSKSSFEIESMVNDSRRSTNASLERWERLSKELMYQSDNHVKVALDINGLLKKMEQSVSDVSSKILNSHEAIMMAQNGFIDNCYRIQNEETQVYDMIDFRLIEMNQTIYKSAVVHNQIKDHDVQMANKLDIKLDDIQGLLEKLVKRLKASKELDTLSSSAPSTSSSIFIPSTTMPSMAERESGLSTDKDIGTVDNGEAMSVAETVVKVASELGSLPKGKILKPKGIKDGTADIDDIVKKTEEDPLWSLRNKMID